MIHNLMESLLEKGDYDVDNSFENFHARGVYYVCLLRSPKLTIKLYHFVPEELEPLIDKWGRHILVNPHTHRYDFQTLVLEGGMTNITYSDIPGLGSSNDHKVYYKGKFENGLSDGLPKMWPATSISVLPYREQDLRPGDYYNCRINDIHSIAVHPWRKTTLAVFQYYDKVSHNYLYTPDDKPLDFSNLYTKMYNSTAFDIIKRAKEAVKHL